MARKRLSPLERESVRALWNSRAEIRKEIEQLHDRLRQLTHKHLANRFDVSTDAIRYAINEPEERILRRNRPRTHRCVVLPNGTRSYRRPLSKPCKECGSVMCAEYSHRQRKRVSA